MVGSRVYVGGLPYGVRERDLERFFKGYGRTRDILIKNGYGFVVSSCLHVKRPPHPYHLHANVHPFEEFKRAVTLHNLMSLFVACLVAIILCISLTKNRCFGHIIGIRGPSRCGRCRLWAERKGAAGREVCQKVRLKIRNTQITNQIIHKICSCICNCYIDRRLWTRKLCKNDDCILFTSSQLKQHNSRNSIYFNCIVRACTMFSLSSRRHVTAPWYCSLIFANRA